MLEVRHLRKEYKSKKGVVTKALDDVSLTFAETGMVFILGKSGSGKSTLLNICGGLDRADSGEIIIKGKSSNDFSGQDFDSYRNTYVGFVFQEYNILDEFTVEENIALALELQNKKRDKEVIDKILADVDMTSFASRKPNTLSGGQKQRVAIARALVKEPEIIMADEPTGALDSKTGQQVFDTLKHLSQTKLVLVISHDRDFAEQYGDRIIELKDGKVISDQTRAEDGDGAKNVRFFGSDTVCVARGSDITDEDMQNIRKFLTKSGGAAVISTSRDRIAEMKQDQPEMSVGAFEDLKEQPQSKSYPQQKLIRSHLPVRHAIRMGGSSLKTKPVRLVFTILLSVIAFVLFGLASTLMLFDGKAVTKESLKDAPDSLIILSKAYWQNEKSYEGDDLKYENEVKLATGYTFDEYKALREKYSGAIAGINTNMSFTDISMTDVVRQFYVTSADGLIITDPSLTYASGRAPEGLDEIAITDYLFDGLKNENTKITAYKITGEENDRVIYEGEELNVNSANDIIYSENNPVWFRFNGTYFKITGVFNGMAVSDDYTALKTAADQSRPYNENTMLQWMWMSERSNGLYARIAVSEELAREYAENATADDNFQYSMYFDYNGGEVIVGVDYNGDVSGEYLSMISKYDPKGERPTLNVVDFDGKALDSLPSGSVALRYDSVAAVLNNLINNKYNELYYNSGVMDQMNDAYNAAIAEYWDDNRYPQMDDYHDRASYQADLESYNQACSAYCQAAYERAYDEYTNSNAEPNRDDYANDSEYSNAVSDYNTNRYNFANAAWNEAENVYVSEHPRPNYDDYLDDSYYAAVDEYEANREAYAEAARLNAAGMFKSYFEYKASVEAAARAEYIAKNPEPDRKDESYNDWFDGLNSYVNEAWWQADPTNILHRIAYSDSTIVDKQAVYAAIKLVYGFLEEWEVADELVIYSGYNGNASKVKIAGMYFEGNQYGGGLYVSDDLYDDYFIDNGYHNTWRYEYETKYVVPEDAFISVVYINKTDDVVNELVDQSYLRGDDDSSVMIKNAVMTQLEMVIEMADSLGTAFLIAGVVLALFAFLLMFNFISASITAKKKEIGILRAIGARTTDVFKIFLSEAMIIALICFVISTAGALGACILLNTTLVDTAINVSLFVFGPLSVVCILAIALVTAIVSTVIPVGMYSRKPPVASIRAL